MVFEERNNCNSVVVAGMWQRKGVTRNAGKGRGVLCFDEKDAKDILLDCLETRNWRMKFLNEKRSSMNTK